MSKICFKEKSFKPDVVALIEKADEIVADYQSQGFRMTLRQLYYQFVSRDLITNEEKSYKNLAKLVSDARLAGLLDWDAIEDRGRVPDVPQEFKNLKHLTDVALGAYKLPRWEGQESYVELWVEKQALAGVLSPLASKFHVTLMVNKGYSSQSAMYESAMRFRAHCQEDEETGERKSPVLLYLGDHDPSGEDMVRDIRDRMAMFGVRNLTVTKVALTMDQIEEHQPPPNPAKLTDPRAQAYIAQHGDSSWEVDALPPPVLGQLITSGIKEYLDVDKFNVVLANEEKDKKVLKETVAKL